MARQVLQQCKQCQSWTLKTECPSCNSKTSSPVPLKWSPEDNRATIRRKLYNVDSQEWIDSLPLIPTISSLRENIHEEE